MNPDIYSFARESKWNLLFIILMGWVIGGLYETLVFHGFMFTRFERMLTGKRATLISFVITNIIFALYHIVLGPVGVINAFIVGSAYLALALHFNRNLWYTIICHGMYNTIILILIYLDYL